MIEALLDPVIAWSAAQPLVAALMLGVLLDVVIGDPQVRCHPIRLLGDWSLAIERMIPARMGYSFGTGVLHTLLSIAVPLAIWSVGSYILSKLFVNYSFVPILWDACFIWAALSNRDLLSHAAVVERALRRGQLEQAQRLLARFVGRDTDRLDPPALRRATIETLSESVVDGVAMPLFWFAVAGMPGLIIAKVISTLDSMIGYRRPPYTRYGTFAARCDDVLNWLPARLTAALLVLLAGLRSSRFAVTTACIAWRWHAMLPSPNSGWVEAAYAGFLRVRLVGPIWSRGNRVNEAYLGPAAWSADPGPSGAWRALVVSLVVMVLWLIIACLIASMWFA